MCPHLLFRIWTCHAFVKDDRTPEVNSDVDTFVIIFHNAHCTHQNKCTDNTTVHIFILFTQYYMSSEDSYSNLSFRIILIDICTRMDKTIYSSMKIQVNWFIIL